MFTPTEEIVLPRARLLHAVAALFLATLGAFAGKAHAVESVDAAIVVNDGTGQVITAVNADEPEHPASLAKMMTLYLAFQALQNGTITLDQSLPVSYDAAAKAPTKLGLRAGQQINVEDCILGMITKSANDAASVMGENLGGSEDAFADMMNDQAQRLGMTHTHFENASGLPDPDDATTARDMVTLARALYHDFPQYSHYFATKEFVFEGRVVRGHNNLMDRYPGMDGLKTGYTNAAGFNLASTAVRDGQRLFAVVLGTRAAGVRDNLMAQLLDDGFDNRETPEAMVAMAEGRPHAGTARRLLAALSPISNAEADTAPVSARKHHRAKATTTASHGCTKHGKACTAPHSAKGSSSGGVAP